MNIQVKIERLVVDASLGLDSHALAEAVIEGLSRALVQPSGVSLLRLGGSIAALSGGTIHFEPTPASWGEQLASAIDGTLGNLTHNRAEGLT